MTKKKHTNRTQRRAATETTTCMNSTLTSLDYDYSWPCAKGIVIHNNDYAMTISKSYLTNKGTNEMMGATSLIKFGG